MHPQGTGRVWRQARILLLALVLLLAIPGVAAAAGEPAATVAGYYFTGDGCPHCARVNPVLFREWLPAYPGLVIVEYEVFSHRENAVVMAGMDRSSGIGLGVPVLFFGQNATFTGDSSILAGVPGFLNRTLGEEGPQTGLVSLGSLDIAGLPGYPQVWEGDRILIREGPGGNTTLLRALLSGGDPATLLAGGGYTDLGPRTVELTGTEVPFGHTLRVDGWLFGWNGEPAANATATPLVTAVPTSGPPTAVATPTPTTATGSCPPPPEATAGKIMALAAVNAMNPCALAVLVVILLAIITNNPGRREQVLLAGLAFALSVFIFYLVYGLLLVSLLSSVREMAGLQVLLTRALGLVSIAIGLFHVREYRSPGRDSLGTGIPRGWRRRLGELLDGITSPIGAFIIGALVTLFLLPCNIAPYLIGCGILAVYGPWVALPYLLLYNLVFILPMLAITAVVYLGVARIGDVKGWREKNIGRFHLASGLILIAFGVLLLFGVI